MSTVVDHIESNYKTSCHLKREMIKKLHDGTLNEKHIEVVIDEVFKLGRGSKA